MEEHREEKEIEMEQVVEHKASGWEWFSRVLSVVFNPLLMPLYFFVLLFRKTYLMVMPFQYSRFVLGIVLTFTVLAPLLFVGIYLWINRIGLKGLTKRRRRFVPYLMVGMSYLTCCILMERMHFPYYFSGVIKAGLVSLVLCCLMNLRWRVSMHLTGCGLFIGSLLVFSYLFQFNPVGWLCGCILLAGMQGTARISYHRHTLWEVIAGFVVGMFCGIIGISFI